MKVSFLTKKRFDAVYQTEAGFIGNITSPSVQVKKYVFPYNTNPVHSLFQLMNPLNFLKLVSIYRGSDIVHYSCFDVYFIVYHLLLRRIFPAKSVLTVFHLEKDSTNNLLDRLGLYQKIYLSFDAYIAISRFTRDQLVSLGVDRTKITVAPLGIDKGMDYKKTDRKHYSYILFVGDEYPRKNLKTLFYAFKNVLKVYPYLKLIKIGSVKNPDHAVSSDTVIKELGLEKKVLFIRRHVSTELLVRYYSGAAALVSCSTLEGFGLPVVEAMRCRCLPLISAIPTYKEFGLPVSLYIKNPLDVSEWGRKLKKILALKPEEKDKLRKTLYVQSYAYTWDNFTDIIAKMYERLK